MIERMLRWIVLGGVFALPFIVFIVAESLFFPFITGKNFAFRIIIEVVTGAWLALALLNPSFRPKRSSLLGVFAVFIIVVALADVLGVYPFKSFWSNFERMDGWVTLAHLFCYFLVAASVLNTEKLWRAFWHTSLGVSGVVGLYGLLQLAGIVSLNPGFSSVSRIDATFGNPIYLAAYMLFHVFIAASYWSRAWEERTSGRRLAPSLLYGGILVLDTLILLLTSTRGAMLGLVAGLLLTLTLIAFSSREHRRAALVVMTVIILLGSGFWFAREQSWVQRVPFLQRLATISVEDATTKARFYNWGMAWKGVQERPLLGWGQENYAIVFDKYYDPRMYAQEQWFDRVHNIIFDWLVAAGFLGLISYLSLYSAALWMLWRKRAQEVFSSLEKSILTGLLGAYFVSIFFVFDNITSYLLFATVLAYIASRGSSQSSTLSLPTIPRSFAPFVAVGAVVVVWSIAWFVNAAPLAANRALLSSLAPHQGGIQENLDYFKKSIAYGSLGTQEAREQLTQVAAQVVQAENVSAEIKQNFLNTAAEEMRLMAESVPLSARFPLFLGTLLAATGNYAQAIEALEKAHELSPGKQTILFQLASTKYASGDIEGALTAFKQAFELEPAFNDARIFYIAALIRAQQDSLAEELLAPLIEKGEAADVRIAAAYVSRSRYDKVASIWEKHITERPEDVNAYFTLAAAYYGAGNSSRAISTLEKVGSLVPAAKERADALIGQIRSGAAKLTQ